jgi:hypothetical protein
VAGKATTSSGGSIAWKPRIQREARDGNRYRGSYDQAGWSDRDRDGRNDRYEDDRGYNHD